MSEVKTAKAVCPDCGETITLKGSVRLGQEVICSHCDAELEVVETDPLELDWAYDDHEAEEEEDEDW
ncbi:MAG TPA: lysine biosynthesis protein LysW [Anaerolineae bacterium]|nr:lysine biosynthesis protein LysW [Anaerolineae bacterium]